MPADFSKCNNSNDYKFGVTCFSGTDDFTSLARQLSTLDFTELVSNLSEKFKNFLYYQESGPVFWSAVDTHSPASNTDAVVTYTADAYSAHVIRSIAYEYDASPTGGLLTVEDGAGNVVFTKNIAAAGAGYVEFYDGLKGTVNEDMIITLAAGGSGVSGTISVIGHQVV